MGAVLVFDSWWSPTAPALQWAKAKGAGAWLGYFKQTPQDNIYAGWDDATFAAVKAAGLQTAAYCSGYQDPLWVKQRAASLGIIPILDVETSIRPDGPWVDAWLSASGAALYGLGSTIAAHSTHGHAGYVEAAYPSNSGTANPINPGLTWTVALPNPSRPIARQFAGSVPSPYGSLDYSEFDSTFFEVSEVLPLGFKQGLVHVLFALARSDTDTAAERDYWAAQLADDGSNLEQLVNSIVFGASADSETGAAHLARVRAAADGFAPLEAQVAAIPGAGQTVPAHTHSVAGSTGPVVVNVA